MTARGPTLPLNPPLAESAQKETHMTRQSPHPKVHQLFVDRWSPRAFDETDIPQDDLEAIFAAAGLAPSAFNYQPWKFLYARRGDENWERFLSLLIPFNQSWAKDASVLIFIVSDTKMGDQPSHSHSFDAGAAWAQMALQATLMGYHAHGMTGLEFDKARAELGIPEGFRLEAAVAIGRLHQFREAGTGDDQRADAGQQLADRAEPLDAVGLEVPIVGKLARGRQRRGELVGDLALAYSRHPAPRSLPS